MELPTIPSHDGSYHKIKTKWLTGDANDIPGAVVYPYAVASDTLQNSSDAEKTFNNNTPALKKSMSVILRGTARVKFSIKTNNVSYPCFGRIYVNGVETGTARNNATTSYVEYSEDINIGANDSIEIYCYINSSATGYLNNFRVYFTLTKPTAFAEITQD